MFHPRLLEQKTEFLEFDGSWEGLTKAAKERAFLASIDSTDIARALSNVLLKEIAETHDDLAGMLQNYADRVLQGALQKARSCKTDGAIDVVQELEKARLLAEQDRELENLAQENYNRVKNDTVRRNLYLAHMARIAQILELSSHLARENFFDIKRKENDVPGGIRGILHESTDDADATSYTSASRRYRFKTLDEAIKYLGKPVLEISLTQHPTNILTLKTILLKRQLHNATREVCTNPQQQLDELKGIIRRFVNEELTPVDEKTGKIAYFSAKDELDLTLDTVQQVDANLIDLYSSFESEFIERFEDSYTRQKRWDFFLNLRINSWTIGDKDGNKNAKAEHLLLATAMHRQTAVKMALQHIDKIQVSGVDLEPGWQQELKAAQENLNVIVSELEAARIASGGVDLVLKQADLDRLNLATANALGRKWGDFEETYLARLREIGETASDHQQDALLGAFRSMKTLGIRAAKIELRETAKEYTAVIAYLVKEDADGNPIDYMSLNEEGRAQLLDALITKKPDYLAQRAQEFLAECDATELREYDDKNPKVIAYHTLKRLQVVASNPDMCGDNILAECKGAHHMLECLALQKMVRGAKGEPLQQHIVPLFEDYTTLRSIARTLKAAFKYKSYRTHVWELAKGIWKALRQKFQIAHSDNIRRSGMAAGRGGIHAANYDVPVAMRIFTPVLKKLYESDLGHKITTAFKLTLEAFQGGSLTHILRGGGRAITAQANAFESHYHTKITGQGLDQSSHIGLPGSFNRMMTRYFGHCAKEIALKEMGEKILGSHRSVERAITEAFAQTMPDYVNKHFGSEDKPRDAGMGHLLAHRIIDYFVYSKVGNRGLRSAGRSKGSAAKDFINTEEDTRAIGIVENMFDADLLGTWLGVENLHEKMSEQLLKRSCYDKFSRQINSSNKPNYSTIAGPRGNRLLTREELNGLYKTSPQFRDVMDQMACGLIASNVNRLQRRMLDAQAKGVAMNDDVFKYVFETLPAAYIKGTELVLKAFGIAYDAEEVAKLDPEEKITFLRHLVATHAIPHYAAEYGVKGRFAGAAVLARDEILSAPANDNQPLSDQDLRALSDLAAGRMTTSHGRVFNGEDPHYASAVRKYINQRAANTQKLAA